MLRVDIRQLGSGGVETKGSILSGDPVFQGLDFEIVGAVEVGGKLQATEGSGFLWRGELSARVVGECRRCLERVEQVVEDEVVILFSADPELEEDPGVYPIEDHSTTVDLSGAVREELTLRTSAFPLCREDCKGLCANCGADLNAGPCGCAASGTTS